LRYVNRLRGERSDAVAHEITLYCRSEGTLPTNETWSVSVILFVRRSHFGRRSARPTLNTDSCVAIFLIWRNTKAIPLHIGFATLPRPILLVNVGDAATWPWQPDGT
jgi:hypothetical protein